MDQILAVASGHRLTITINRPERRNSIGFTAIRGIRDAVRSAANDADISVIVLTGAGDKAFCSGADLSEIAEGTAAGHEARGEDRVLDRFAERASELQGGRNSPGSDLWLLIWAAD